MVNKKLRLDTITILLELLRYFNPKTILREGGWAGGAGQAMAYGNKTTELERTSDLKTPRTPKPILPAVCEKNIFCFIHSSSASGKRHF